MRTAPEKRKGFALIELLIVVAVLGIAAAIALPALMRARVAANESATVGDIRTVISAQAAYAAANQGFYDGRLTCLTFPSSSSCIPSYPPSAPTFLDSMLSSLMAKAGYNRVFSALTITPPPGSSPTSTNRYRYDATPTVIGQTGVRGFAGDYTNRLCFTANGAAVLSGMPLPANCQDLR